MNPQAQPFVSTTSSITTTPRRLSATAPDFVPVQARWTSTIPSDSTISEPAVTVEATTASPIEIVAAEDIKVCFPHTEVGSASANTTLDCFRPRPLPSSFPIEGGFCAPAPGAPQSPRLDNLTYSADSKEQQRQNWRASDTDLATHHFNWCGNSVPVQSSTPPATSLAIIMSQPKGLLFGPQQDLYRSTLMSQAMEMVDPVVYVGSSDVLRTKRGTKLQEAVTGLCATIYSSVGWWTDRHYQYWGADDDVPLTDEMSISLYEQEQNASMSILNGWYENHNLPRYERFIEEDFTKAMESFEQHQAMIKKRRTEPATRRSTLMQVVSRDDLDTDTDLGLEIAVAEAESKSKNLFDEDLVDWADEAEELEGHVPVVDVERMLSELRNVPRSQQNDDDCSEGTDIIEDEQLVEVSWSTPSSPIQGAQQSTTATVSSPDTPLDEDLSGLENFSPVKREELDRILADFSSPADSQLSLGHPCDETMFADPFADLKDIPVSTTPNYTPPAEDPLFANKIHESCIASSDSVMSSPGAGSSRRGLIRSKSYNDLVTAVEDWNDREDMPYNHFATSLSPISEVSEEDFLADQPTSRTRRMLSMSHSQSLADMNREFRTKMGLLEPDTAAPNAFDIDLEHDSLAPNELHRQNSSKITLQSPAVENPRPLLDEAIFDTASSESASDDDTVEQSPAGPVVIKGSAAIYSTARVVSHNLASNRCIARVEFQDDQDDTMSYRHSPMPAVPDYWPDFDSIGPANTSQYADQLGWSKSVHDLQDFITGPTQDLPTSTTRAPRDLGDTKYPRRETKSERLTRFLFFRDKVKPKPAKVTAPKKGKCASLIGSIRKALSKRR